MADLGSIDNSDEIYGYLLDAARISKTVLKTEIR